MSAPDMDRRSFLKFLGLAAATQAAVQVAVLAPSKKRRVPKPRSSRVCSEKYPAAAHEAFLTSNSPSSFIPELWDRKFAEQFYGSSLIAQMEEKQAEFTRVMRRMVT